MEPLSAHFMGNAESMLQVQERRLREVVEMIESEPCCSIRDLALKASLSEPLTADEANRLASLCNTHEEKLIVWTLLDTGLRVAELANLTKDNIDWQGHRLMIYGKGGPYGTQSKRRVIPLAARVQPLLEGHFALHDTFGLSVSTLQRVVRTIANAHRSAARFHRMFSGTRSASQPCRRGSACRPCSDSWATTTWPPRRSI